MSFKETMNKIGSYVKERITKKEITTVVGLILMVAAPAGWLSVEHVEAIKIMLESFGISTQPVGVGSAVLTAVGSAMFAAKEKE